MFWPESTYTRKQLVVECDVVIGHALAMLREGQNLNQSEVAKRLGCGQPLVSKIESGQRSLKFAEVDIYAQVLGISRDELVDALNKAIDDKARR